jgi:hypothetical protein
MTLIFLWYFIDSWFLELLVQTSKTNTGKLKETLPKALTHSTEKLKIIKIQISRATEKNIDICISDSDICN